MCLLACEGRRDVILDLEGLHKALRKMVIFAPRKQIAVVCITCTCLRTRSDTKASYLNDGRQSGGMSVSWIWR